MWTFFIIMLVSENSYDYTKQQIDLYVVEELKDEKYKEVWMNLTSFSFEPQFWGAEAVISNSFLVVNYLAHKGMLDLYCKMAKCSFPYYRAIAAVGLRTFKKPRSQKFLEVLKNDHTEVLTGPAGKSKPMISFTSAKISDIAKGKKLQEHDKLSSSINLMKLE